MADYTVLRTQPVVYLDNQGNPVSGYRISVELTAYDEVHYLEVPKLDPAAVKKQIDALLASRAAIAKL
jgi:hypothetical protein